MNALTPHFQDSHITLYNADVLQGLSHMRTATGQCVVTSPPYWGLRDYGVEGQIGLEKTPEEYIEKMVAVFQEVKRVLKDDGILWLNMGDKYANPSQPAGEDPTIGTRNLGDSSYPRMAVSGNVKPKDLYLMPHRLALALQADGWFVRADNVWAKPNPMPESVTDRTTRAHEYVFQLTKSGTTKLWYHRDKPYSGCVYEKPEPDYRWIHKVTNEETPIKPEGWLRGLGGNEKQEWQNWRRVNLWKAHDYYYDADAIAQPLAESTANDKTGRYSHKPDKQRGHSRRHDGFNDRLDSMPKEQQQSMGANKRSVWTIATRPYPDAHFATFPPELARICILAGSRPGDIVLDPFAGSGTALDVAVQHQRKGMGIELNADYCKLITDRFKQRTIEFPLVRGIKAATTGGTS